MFFVSISILIFILFLLALPILFLIGFFKVFSFGFEKLGLTSQATFLLLLLTLIGSRINIPLTRYKVRYVRKSSLFGFFSSAQKEVQGLAINLGGAIIPIIISGYLFYQSKEVLPIFLSLAFVIVICKMLSKVIPGRGIVLPALIPPIFSALFSIILYSQNPAVCAYISGTLGTLIGADILNLHRLRRLEGLISIGGAGVFDGIFLTGIVSVLLTAL